MSEVVGVRGLEVGYRSRRAVLLPELTLAPGECVALVGESGSGKTSIALALLGLLDASAYVRGSAVVCGHQVVGAGEADLRDVRGEQVAFVPQSPQAALNPTMRIGALLRRSLARQGIRGRPARQRCDRALAEVALDAGLLRRYPHEISGGQAQRFVIAMALARGVKLIIADEATSALDVTTQAGIVAVLQRLRSDHGTAIMIVSHDLALVSTLADRIVVLRAGAVVDAGPTDAVISRPAAYTRALLDAVPTLEPTRR